MTCREDLLSKLNMYGQTWAKETFECEIMSPKNELATLKRFHEFVSSQPQCFHRTNQIGHITGSALVVNEDLTKVLLTHHRKLNIWLQLGGHADGHPIAHEVALNEAYEESGLSNLSLLRYERDVFGSKIQDHIPFDLDCHTIPANPKDPEHLHFDVRFLVLASDRSLPVVSEESHDVQWFTLDGAREITQETSMRRQFAKVEWLKKNLNL